MAVEHSVMSDDLLRQIIGVGRVDLLVGVPQFDDGETAAAVIGAVRAAFRSRFPRQRAALLHAGNEDAALAAAIREAWDAAEPSVRGGLRTTHLITTRGATPEADGAGARVILAAAELLQASAVVVLDSESGDVTPDRVATLATPLTDTAVDLLAPLYTRPADQGLLVSQLLRPLTRALFARDLREPLLPEFGCSGRFVTHCMQTNTDITRAIWRSHYWIAAEVMTTTFGLRQQQLGPRPQPRRAASATGPTLLQDVIGSVFLVLDRHDRNWLARPATIDEVPAPTDAMQLDTGAASRALASFATDLGNLDEILTRILPADVHAALRQASTADGGPRLPAGLWAEVAMEFLLAHHHVVMRREHIIQALLPLYIARTGTFLIEHGTNGPALLDAELELLCRHFEHFKPRIVERWAQPAER
jgi:hypothetical protein